MSEATAHGCRLASRKKTARIFGSMKKICYFCSGEAISMTTRREKSKPQKPQMNKQLEAMNAETEQKKKVNQRQEKLADFLIDVAKYVFTGVIITSLFNDVSDKTTLLNVGLSSLNSLKCFLPANKSFIIPKTHFLESKSLTQFIGQASFR